MNDVDKEQITELDFLRQRVAELETSQAASAEENARLENELNQARHDQEVQLANIQSLQIQLREQTIRDPLTGLYNRRYLQETIERETARSDRSHSPISMLMIDIDNLKRVNEQYGHEAGDEVIIALGKMLRSHLRLGDIVCRFGGEEFVAVMPGAYIENAYLRAEHIRSEFAAEPVHFAGQEIYITISVGAAMYPADGKTGQEVLSKADNALFMAKRAGRNRTLATPEPD